jgi:hypothetical protein
VIVGAGLATDAFASGRGCPKEMQFTSPTGSHVFEVIPQKPRVYRPGHCKGELFRLKGDERELVWSRHLINNRAVHRAVVSDSGRYVVTLDDWDKDGVLPIVIYGRKGSLRKIHSLESLGLDKDYEHIPLTTAGRHWKEHSLVFFGPDEKTLYIRLRWGDMLMIEMHLGEVMDEEWYRTHRGWAITVPEWNATQEYGEKRSRELAVDLLRSDDPHDQVAAAIAAGQLKVRDAIPGLKALLNSQEHLFRWKSGEPRKKVYYVREAATEALDVMGESIEGVVVEEGMPP